MRLALLLLLIAFPALADTVTLSTGASCDAASINYDYGSKSFAVQCKGSAPPATCQPPAPATTTAACPAGQTGSITTSYVCSGAAWTPVVTSTCQATPPPSGCGGSYVDAALGPQSVSTIFNAQPNTAYAFPIPPLGGRFQTSGTITSGSLTIEMGISKCKGDFTYWQSEAAKVILFGIPQYPCGGVFGTESGGVNWSPVQGTTVAYCLTPNPGPWYLNARVTSGCPAGGCSFVYTWQAH